MQILSFTYRTHSASLRSLVYHCVPIRWWLGRKAACHDPPLSELWRVLRCWHCRPQRPARERRSLWGFCLAQLICHSPSDCGRASPGCPSTRLFLQVALIQLPGTQSHIYGQPTLADCWSWFPPEADELQICKCVCVCECVFICTH